MSSSGKLITLNTGDFETESFVEKLKEIILFPTLGIQYAIGLKQGMKFRYIWFKDTN